jgi:FKBP-type peptidyl-prolyl cis-trans isomerase
MFKQIFLSAGAGAALLLAGCDNPVDRPDCEQVFNSAAEQRGDTIVTTTGLRYNDTEVGTGATVVACRGVAVTLRGTFVDETEFQERIGMTFAPGITNLVDGVTQGVIGMRVGGTRRLIVPPALGYGSEDLKDRDTGEVVIPANSTIIFDIGALAVEP